VVEQGDDELARDAPLQQPHLLHHVQAVGHHLRRPSNGVAAGVVCGVQQQGNGLPHHVQAAVAHQPKSYTCTSASCLGDKCFSATPRLPSASAQLICGSASGDSSVSSQSNTTNFISATNAPTN